MLNIFYTTLSDCSLFPIYKDCHFACKDKHLEQRSQQPSADLLDPEEDLAGLAHPDFCLLASMAGCLNPSTYHPTSLQYVHQIHLLGEGLKIKLVYPKGKRQKHGVEYEDIYLKGHVWKNWRVK